MPFWLESTSLFSRRGLTKEGIDFKWVWQYGQTGGSESECALLFNSLPPKMNPLLYSPLFFLDVWRGFQFREGYAKWFAHHYVMDLNVTSLWERILTSLFWSQNFMLGFSRSGFWFTLWAGVVWNKSLNDSLHWQVKCVRVFCHTLFIPPHPNLEFSLLHWSVS